MSRLLLALLVAPLIVGLSPSGAAIAATVYGAPGMASLHFSDWRPGSGADCNVTAYYAVTGAAQEVRYRLKCSQEWNGAIEGADFTITFGGNATGGACTLLDQGHVGDEGNGSGSATWLSTGGMCQVGTVCMSSHRVQDNMWDRTYAQVCTGIDLGDVPGASSGPTDCEYGAPKRPVVEAIGKDAGSSYFSQYVINDVKAGSTSRWLTYAITKPVGDNPLPNSAEPNSFLAMGVQLDASQFPNRWRVLMSDSNQPANRTIIGVGMYRMPQTSSTWDNQFLPQDGPAGLVGVTDPSRCSYYWGTKIASVTGSDVDEPAGSLDGGDFPTEEPTDEPAAPTTESGCGNFSLTDPSTWAAGGICALVSAITALTDALVSLLGDVVGVLGSILSAITGLVASLLDGLVGLFVPDAAVMQQQVQGLQDAWGDTSLAKWQGAMFGGSVTMPAAGCGGVPVDFDLPGGVAVDMDLGAACSGGAAQAAGIVKIAVTAALIFYGGLACIRALGSGFGWSPSVGRGGEA